MKGKNGFLTSLLTLDSVLAALQYLEFIRPINSSEYSGLV